LFFGVITLGDKEVKTKARKRNRKRLNLTQRKNAN